jgi:glyoxylase-like metal-dependent hydrolase (beta-lactamase superfamily II)
MFFFRAGACSREFLRRSLDWSAVHPSRSRRRRCKTHRRPPSYRFKIGSIEATAISDGPLSLGEPKPDVFIGLSKEEFGKTLTENFLPTDNVVLQQNALVINTGDLVALFDTGMGTNKMLGPDTGRLPTNLKAAGIEPKDVDAVVLTHAHPDHCFGLMADNGAPTFPNAQIYMTQADFDFWTDEAKLSNDMLKAFVAGARKQLLPNRDRMVFIKDRQEFLPGVQAVSAPGHTVRRERRSATSATLPTITSWWCNAHAWSSPTIPMASRPSAAVCACSRCSRGSAFHSSRITSLGPASAISARKATGIGTSRR